jgi:alkanesulfonate monooxygenase SsuD/methylene tetrahydromethanopterin reductase-like flavin-dependent oxidoreductase (luciferase family)
MRFGVVILADRPWASSRQRWQRAEEYGFDHAWTYDHIGWRDLVAGPWFDAVPTLAAAALVTDRIRLGTFVASPNFRHPVPFAREVTALDDLSQGRLVLGIGAGAGGTSYDATVLGQPELSPRTRADRFGEFLDLLDALLVQDVVTWEGEHYAAVQARSTPGCVQTPRVPFVVAASGPRTMRFAVHHGQGWVTTGRRADDQAEWWRGVGELSDQFDDALARAGRDPSTVDRYLSLDAAPVFSLSSVDAFADAVGRAEELRFTDVVVHWPRESGSYAGDEAILEHLAAGVLSKD